VLNSTGVSFSSSARRGTQRDTNLSWQQLSAVRLTPSPGSAAGRLKAITIDGQVVSWLIPHYSCGTRAALPVSSTAAPAAFGVFIHSRHSAERISGG
jgi:hypothetical protein